MKKVSKKKGQKLTFSFFIFLEPEERQFGQEE